MAAFAYLAGVNQHPHLVGKPGVPPVEPRYRLEAQQRPAHGCSQQDDPWHRDTRIHRETLRRRQNRQGDPTLRQALPGPGRLQDSGCRCPYEKGSGRGLTSHRRVKKYPDSYRRPDPLVHGSEGWKTGLPIAHQKAHRMRGQPVGVYCFVAAC